MGNRPINRRPWRKKPWARKVRPTRWNAATNGATDSVVLNTLLPANVAAGLGGNQPLYEIVNGQVDVEPWADDQEVTLDRIVGSLLLYGATSRELDVSGYPRPVIAKFGILVVEDSGGVGVPSIDLFDQEEFEDYEWLWLHTLVLPWDAYLPNSSENEGYGIVNHTIPLDIRNRRKIGQGDQLVMYGCFAAMASGWTVSIQTYLDVRTILMSR